jgi:hypothetical protein
VLKYVGLSLLVVLAGHSVATAQQPGDELKRACAVIAQQRNAALDALALTEAKAEAMKDDANALAAWWAAYVAGLPTNNDAVR